jgi:hypothetical protein
MRLLKYLKNVYWNLDRLVYVSAERKFPNRIRSETESTNSPLMKSFEYFTVTGERMVFDSDERGAMSLQRNI